MRYIVQWDYQSSLGGPWPKDSVVELQEQLADHINRSSPGVLKPVEQKKEARATDAPTNDRQVKAPAKKRAAKK